MTPIWQLILFISLEICHFRLRDPSEETNRSPRDVPSQYHSMSESEQVKVLVSQLARRRHVFPEGQSPSEWPGVLRESRTITGITWSRGEGGAPGIDLGTGFMDTHWLPARLRVFHMRNQPIKGVFSAASLPRTVQDVDIAGCCFMGTVEWERLPASLLSLNVDSNALEGTVEFDQMPPGLRYLVVSSNWFSEAGGAPPVALEVLGLADIVALHEYQILRQVVRCVENSSTLVSAKLGSLHKFVDVTFDDDGRSVAINWANRGLAGSIDLCIVPDSVRFLYLENNSLVGVIDFDRLPRALEILNLSGNRFSQCITLSVGTPDGLRFVDVRQNDVVDVVYAGSGEHQPIILWDGPVHQRRTTGPRRYVGLFVAIFCFIVVTAVTLLALL